MRRSAKAVIGPALMLAAALRGAPAGAAPDGTGDWAGTYAYAADGGRTAGGSAVVVVHTLRLAPASGRPCQLTSSGFQTDTTILCEVTGSAREITVAFRSYGYGRPVNAYGVAVYRPGQPLFRLRRTGRRFETEMLGLGADGARSGALFAKTS
ncbi:DUF5991 domain-containing protein [Methylobacterium oryzisoli]|uniref:DUF5991 domain-containing protein n=1 Tax=Methylobacterium oryzisoli TaxID=3385502 RepID=UPI00389217BA